MKLDTRAYVANIIEVNIANKVCQFNSTLIGEESTLLLEVPEIKLVESSEDRNKLFWDGQATDFRHWSSND